MTSRLVVRSAASGRSLMSAKASIFPMASLRERACSVASPIAAAAASVAFTRARGALRRGPNSDSSMTLPSA
jgi:hypothetical protein